MHNWRYRALLSFSSIRLQHFDLQYLHVELAVAQRIRFYNAPGSHLSLRSYISMVLWHLWVPLVACLPPRLLLTAPRLHRIKWNGSRLWLCFNAALRDNSSWRTWQLTVWGYTCVYDWRCQCCNRAAIVRRINAALSFEFKFLSWIMRGREPGCPGEHPASLSRWLSHSILQSLSFFPIRFPLRVNKSYCRRALSSPRWLYTPWLWNSTPKRM